MTPTICVFHLGFSLDDDNNDATLRTLTVNDGTNDLTMDPTFASATYVYETDVANAITTVTLTATPSYSEAEVTGVALAGTAIADSDFTDGITVPSLVVGDNEIVVTVTAENTTTLQTYTVTVTRADTTGPAAAKVTGVNITPSDQILQVSWTQVTGATGYKIQWKSGGQSYGSSRQATVSSGSTTSQTISNLQNGTEYTVRVIATKTGASDGTPSDDANGTPTAANTVPTAPRDLNATPVGDNRINLSWNAPSTIGGSTITGYKIEVSLNGRTNWTTRVANTGSTNRTYSHTGLSTGDTRHYRVSAINSSGTGPVSNVASATTGLPIVSIAPASATEGDDIVFIITISPPIDGFRRVGYGTGIESLPSGSMGAKKDADYVPHHPSGALVQIGYGLTSVELRFTTIDDDLVEGTELFGIGLYPSNDEGTAFSYGTRNTERDRHHQG